MDQNPTMAEINDIETGEGVEVDVSRLVEGLRDNLLRSIKHNSMKTAWQDMTEQEQMTEIERATTEAAKLVASVVDIVASGNFAVVHARLDNFKVKDGETIITAKGMAMDEVLVTLNHGTKHSVKIVVCDASQFDRSRSNLEPDPDEPELFEEEEKEPEAFKDLDEADAENDARNDGYLAYQNGESANANPHEGGTPENAAWLEGFESQMETGDPEGAADEE